LSRKRSRSGGPGSGPKLIDEDHFEKRIVALRREAERRNALREASPAEITGEAEDQNQVRSGMAEFRP